MLGKVYKGVLYKKNMEITKFCLLFVFILLSLSFVDATITNTDGSAVGSLLETPTPITQEVTTPTPEIQNTVPVEEQPEVGGITKLFIVMIPLGIILCALYFLKKRRKNKGREPKDIDDDELDLWEQANTTEEETTEEEPKGDDKLHKITINNILKDNEKYKTLDDEEKKKEIKDLIANSIKYAESNSKEK